MDNEDLIESIKSDCKLYEQMIDPAYNYLYLQEFTNGQYHLVFNGSTLWGGMLLEINAVIKSLISLKDRAEDYKL